MNKTEEQGLLLKIIGTWVINEIPEYRAFKCANCQNYINKARYHWINSNGFRLPLHLCQQCELKLQQNKVVVKENNTIQNFNNSYQLSDVVRKHFEEIIDKWPVSNTPELKEFTCDECLKTLNVDKDDNQRKGYHIWYKMEDGNTLAELHFHRHCSQGFL